MYWLFLKYYYNLCRNPKYSKLWLGNQNSALSGNSLKQKAWMKIKSTFSPSYTRWLEDAPTRPITTFSVMKLGIRSILALMLYVNLCNNSRKIPITTRLPMVDSTLQASMLQIISWNGCMRLAWSKNLPKSKEKQSGFSVLLFLLKLF